MTRYTKHTCKDCIHFKICNDYVYLVGRDTKVACPDYKSTEDVVPRSEVEKYIINMNAYGLTAKRLAEENERLQAQVNRLKAYDEERDIALHQRLVKQAKQEVARKIFEEIERFLFDDKTLINITKFAELKKKFIGE